MELDKAKRMMAVELRDLITQMPELRDLILALHRITDLADPRGSTPTEDTMRVSHGSSSVERGYERYHRARGLVRRARNDVGFLAHKLNNAAGDGDMEPRKGGRKPAMVRWHAEGKHDGAPQEGCPECKRIA